jgi:hypothetical protein
MSQERIQILRKLWPESQHMEKGIGCMQVLQGNKNALAYARRSDRAHMGCW